MRLACFALVLLLVLIPACGGSHEGAGHEAKATAYQQPIPTPDTTPVKALRTPAGLVLKTEAPAAVTPAPAAEK